MSDNTFGTVFKVTTFGESHGPAIGAVVDGMPAGIAVDRELIQRDLTAVVRGAMRPGQLCGKKVTLWKYFPVFLRGKAQVLPLLCLSATAISTAVIILNSKNFSAPDTLIGDSTPNTVSGITGAAADLQAGRPPAVWQRELWQKWCCKVSLLLKLPPIPLKLEASELRKSILMK